MALCSGIKADGGRCKAQAMHGSEWCIGHHPDKAQARRLRASKGGKRGGRGRPQAELSEVKRRLSELVSAVLEGRTDRGDAAVVSQLLNTYIRAVGVELKVREELELRERLELLEAGLQAQAQKGSRYGA